MTRLTAEVPYEMAGMRLDQVLAELFADYSRSKLQIWVKSGRVHVNDLILKPKDKLEGGETITLDAEAEIVITSKAEPISLDIIFEDESLLIVNKPAGMVVHPAVGNWHGTLLNALLNHESSLETLPRAGIVHRIDKETSGLLMIAKTLQAHNSLTQQLQDRSIVREYLAISRGRMTAGGTVDEPIARHPTDRKRYAVKESGKFAVTHYRVVKRYGGRFQMPADCSEQLEKELRSFKRQALHAAKLGLLHPVTNEYCEWEQPMPDDMVRLLDALTDNEQE